MPSTLVVPMKVRHRLEYRSVGILHRGDTIHIELCDLLAFVAYAGTDLAPRDLRGVIQDRDVIVPRSALSIQEAEQWLIESMKDRHQSPTASALATDAGTS